MRSAVALATAALLLGASCSPFSGTPTGVSFNLKNHQLEVPTAQRLAITFGNPVELRVLAAHLQVSPQTEGDLESGGDGRHFTFMPTTAWLDLTEYRIQVQPFRDLKGNPITGRAWSFMTTVVPRVASFLDGSGVDLAPGFPVEQGGSVNLVFNTAMSPADTAVSANGQPGKLAWSSDGKLAALSTAGMPVGPLELALTGGKDLHSHLAVAASLIKPDVAYTVHIATRHLPFPALVQIPNDDYGAKPQVGVQAAAMVFEYQTEGSIQRLTALTRTYPALSGRPAVVGG